MSSFSDILKAGLDISREIAGEPITYQRGEDTVAITKARPRNRDRRQNRESSSILRFDEQEWCIAREDLVLNEVAIEPADQDRIVREINGQTRTYAVLPDENGVCWEWADNAQTHYHVRTKLYSTE